MQEVAGVIVEALSLKPVAASSAREVVAESAVLPPAVSRKQVSAGLGRPVGVTRLLKGSSMRIRGRAGRGGGGG